MSFEKLKLNFLINFFKKKRKLLWTLNNNINLNQVSSPSISVLNLNEQTTLGKKNEKIFVTNDSYQTWYIMNDKKFHKQFIDEINKLSNQNTEYNFIDIGANTGLLTRCLLNNVKNLKNSFLVEPNRDNIFCIENNLKDYKNINIEKLALDTDDGERKLFIDQNNKGNLSFNFEMMKLKQDKLSFMNSEDNYQIVHCKSVKKYFKQIKNELRNIIKIDVQGHDEVIFQEIPEDELLKTDILILEVTPLNSKTFDKNKFNSNLKFFKKFTNFNGDILTVDQINQMIELKSGKSFDLIFLN
jgi:FkbM family methyltransferase